jgi:TrbL/VirB6 plasmid conjugal transfer protein
MGLLTFITASCDALAATASPSIDALGLRIVIALATIMLVWFGVQESLAAAHGGPGFNMGKFLNFFLLITFAYVLVAYYDSAIPGVGYSLKGFINGGAQYLVAVIGTDSIANMQNDLAQIQASSGPGIIKTIADPYYALAFFFIQVMLALFAATLSLIVGYGAIALTVVGLFGPVLIPFMVVPKLEFLFWNWLRAFIGFCFYKVVAAAVLSVLAQLLTAYSGGLTLLADPGTMVQQIPWLILLVLINVYVLFQVPHLTLAIFSGSTGGSGSGMTTGLLTGATLAAKL